VLLLIPIIGINKVNLRNAEDDFGHATAGEFFKVRLVKCQRPMDLAPVEPHRSALATTLGQARAAKDVQESHGANRQSTTQSLKEILVEGKDQAIRLRGAIRAALGRPSS
jgi:hypothetical protein